ncbi:MAG TPA: hypothetical protein VGM16_00565 [Gammaproteobacteria bacterium]|jgi:hypothetical protein
MLFPDAGALRSLRSPFPEPLTRALPYLLVFACLLLTLAFGGKLWDSNDDVHMAMITHGYGIVSAPSPDVVYSNVIWGWLAMQLGTHFGVEGYTLLMYAVLLGSAAAIAHVLYRNRVPGLVGAALLLAMFLRTLMEPQFTVAAGYAAVAGLALLMSLHAGERRWTAAGSVLFLTVAALLRLQELLFVCLVAAPAVAWWLYRQRAGRGWRVPAALLLGSLTLVAGCKLVDVQHYSGPEWTRFKQMNQLRRPFTDYGMARYFEAHPELLAGTGMDYNDMRMLESWFFVDERVFNPQSLQGLLRRVDTLDYLGRNLRRYRSLTEPLGEIQIELLLALLVLAALASRNRAAAACGLLLLLAAVGVFLLLARAWATRIYPGPLAALTLLCLLDHRRWRLPLLPLAGLALAAAAILNSWWFLQSRAVLERSVATVQQGICAIPPGELQVSWGETVGLSDRFIYTPTAPPGGRCPLTLYAIGVLDLYPASLDQLHRFTGGRDFTEALLAGQELVLLTTDDRLRILGRYFRDHYGMQLEVRDGPVQGGARQRLVHLERPH